MQGRGRRSKALGASDPRNHRDPQNTLRGDLYRPPLYVDKDGRLALEIDDSTSPALEFGPNGLRFQESPGTVLPTTAYAADVGDGAATNIAVSHGLGTQDVVVQVHLAASTYDRVDVPWQATDANTVTLNFAAAPSSGQYRCVVQKG